MQWHMKGRAAGPFLSDWLQRKAHLGSESAPARAPQGLTAGGELLEGWEILGLQGVKEQVFNHLCPLALQQLGERCLSCCKTPLLLSSSSSLPLPQAASPTLSRRLPSPPPGSRAAPAQQSTGQSSSGVAQASTGSVARGARWGAGAVTVMPVSHCDVTPCHTGLWGPVTSQPHPRLGPAWAGQPCWAPEAAVLTLPSAYLNSVPLGRPRRSSRKPGRNVHQ